MIWLLIGVAALLVFGVAAWFYPQLKSRAMTARSAAQFRAFANELGVELARADDHADAGFMSTVASVFGPYGELRHVILRDAGDETVYVLEYLYGARPSPSSYRRVVAVVAVHLAKPIPMFTLQRPRGPARSRTTDYHARGQPLVVHAMGELELWSLKGERKRARRTVEPLVAEIERDPGWDIRGVDDWLVLFNEEAGGDLRRLLEGAMHLRKHLRM